MASISTQVSNNPFPGICFNLLFFQLFAHMRLYYHCCCIQEPVIFSHCVNLKLGHRFHVLLKVCSDSDTGPFIYIYAEMLARGKQNLKHAGIFWANILQMYVNLICIQLRQCFQVFHKNVFLFL